MAGPESIREFLMSRRARVVPEQVGFPADHRRRRVPGLRREEVAMLAGVSTDYYVQIERGQLAGVSDRVLDAITGALRLDRDERRHFFEIVAAVRGDDRGTAAPAAPSVVPAGVQRVMDALTGMVVVVLDPRLDIVAANPLARAFFAPVLAAGANLARFTFLAPDAAEFFPDWDDAAHTSVRLLHMEHGRSPHDQALVALIAELSASGPAFRDRWAQYEVEPHIRGTKSFRLPEIGVVELRFETFLIPGTAGLAMACYDAEPGSADAARLGRLAARVAASPV